MCKGKNAKDEDLNFAKEIFDYLGKTLVMQEKMINAATAICGSGPAYIYYDIEINQIDPSDVSEEIRDKYIVRLTEAAKKIGFNPQTAEDLARNTTDSSLQLLLESGLNPAELREQITSKGGTTEAALKILAGGGSWEQAAEAAKRRAEELSKKE